MLELRSRRSRIALEVVLVLAIVPFLFPLVVMFYSSGSGAGFAANYGAVLARPEFFQFVGNSARISAGVVALTLACTMLAAYALATLPVRFREGVFFFLVGALTLPSAALSVPLFITIRQLGLYNDALAVILPVAALQTAFSVLLARGFIAGIPRELIDAARVDGSGSFRILWSVVLPLSRPIIAVIVVWAFISSWNEYLMPLLFLQDLDQQTITLLPQFFVGQYSSDQTKVFAASVLIALPTVICYVAFQRFFERGLAAGGIK